MEVVILGVYSHPNFIYLAKCQGGEENTRHDIRNERGVFGKI